MHQKSNYKDSFVNQSLYKNRIAFEEIKTVLKNSNNNKTACSDEIEMQLIKYSPHCILI